jgi:hypothetical protein
MVTALPDHFEGEDVIITFEQDGVQGVANMEGKILSWEISGGSSPTEDIFAFGNKTFNFGKPREKFQLKFDVMVNNSDFDLIQFGSSATGAVIGDMTGKLVRSTDAVSRWRVIMWFQAASEHIRDLANGIVVPSKKDGLYRMIMTDVKSVTLDKSFSADEYFKGTLTLEFAAADSDGYANFFEEEGTSASTMSSLTTTTGTDALLREAKGYLDWDTSASAPAWDQGPTTAASRKSYRYVGTAW